MRRTWMTLCVVTAHAAAPQAGAQKVAPKADAPSKAGTAQDSPHAVADNAPPDLDIHGPCAEELMVTHCANKQTYLSAPHMSTNMFAITRNIFRRATCLHSLIPMHTGSRSSVELSDQCFEAVSKWHVDAGTDLLTYFPELAVSCATEIEASKCDSKGDSQCWIDEIARNGASLVSLTCQNALKEFLYLLSITLELDTRAWTTCKASVKQYCSGDRSSRGYSAQCLKHHMDDAAFDTKCKEALFRRRVTRTKLLSLMRNVQQSHTLDGEFVKVCNDDALKLCGQYEGTDAIYACMEKPFLKQRQALIVTGYLHAARKNVSLHDVPALEGAHALSDACFAKMADMHRKRSTDIRTNPKVMKYCHRAGVQFCKVEMTMLSPDAINGGVMKCLRKHLDRIRQSTDDEDSERCTRAIEETLPFAAEFGGNVDQRKACVTDVKHHCAHVKHKSQVNDCLIHHWADISEVCRKELHDIVKLKNKYFGSGIVGMNPVLEQMCVFTIDKHCPPSQYKEKTLDCLLERHAGVNAPMHPDRDDVDLNCYYAVAEEIERSNQDYRLINGVSSECDEEVETLCETESANTAPGAIIQCLITKIKQIKADSPCLPAVKHMMGMQSATGKLPKTCEADVNKFCMPKGDEPAGSDDVNNEDEGIERTNGFEIRTHDCLLRHFVKLESDCVDVLMELTSERNKAVKWNPLLKNACTKELTKHCSDKSDDGPLMECLTAHFEAGALRDDHKCHQVVMHVVRRENMNYRFDPALQRHCGKEAKVWCKHLLTKDHISKDADKGRVLGCLIKNAPKLKNEQCKSMLVHKLRARNENLWLDPEAATDCHEELRKFCSDVEYGHGRKMKCLRSNRKYLAPNCAALVFTRDKMMVNNLHLSPMINDNCVVFIHPGAICDAAQYDMPGDLYACLSVQKLNDGCREAMMDIDLALQQSMLVNDRLARVCMATVNTFIGAKKCASSVKKLELSEVAHPVQGKHGHERLRCLIEHFADIVDLDCKDHAIRYARKQVYRPTFYRPGFADVCAKHLREQCKFEVDNCRTSRQMVYDAECQEDPMPCLSAYAKEHGSGTTDECIREVFHIQQLIASDVRLRKTLVQACESEIETLCKDIGDAKQMVASCLLVNLKEKPDLFSPPCVEALGMLPKLNGKLESVYMRAVKLATKVLGPEAGSWLELHGMMAFIAIGCVFLVIGLMAARCLYKYRRRHYTAFVDPDTIGTDTHEL